MTFIINFFKQSKSILISTGIILLSHFILRAIFWIYNQSLFPFISLKNLFLIFSWGLAMDVSGIVWLNIPVFILLFLTQYPQGNRKVLTQICFFLFVALNVTGLAINIIYIGYFSFSKHRSNADLIYVFADSLNSSKSILLHYWPLVLCFVLSTYALVFFSKKIFFSEPLRVRWQIIFFNQLIITAFLFFLLWGRRERPIMPSSPLLQIDPGQLPLAQNSINTFLYSVMHKKHQLLPKKYFTPDELKNIVVTTHYCCISKSKADSTMIKKNVVICILESFSR